MEPWSISLNWSVIPFDSSRRKTYWFQVELKFKHKFRLMLDEGISFGAVGRTGRGLTELYNVPVRLHQQLAAYNC